MAGASIGRTTLAPPAAPRDAAPSPSPLRLGVSIAASPPSPEAAELLSALESILAWSSLIAPLLEATFGR